MEMRWEVPNTPVPKRAMLRSACRTRTWNSISVQVSNYWVPARSRPEERPPRIRARAPARSPGELAATFVPGVSTALASRDRPRCGTARCGRERLRASGRRSPPGCGRVRCARPRAARIWEDGRAVCVPRVPTMRTIGRHVALLKKDLLAATGTGAQRRLGGREGPSTRPLSHRGAPAPRWRSPGHAECPCLRW